MAPVIIPYRHFWAQLPELNFFPIDQMKFIFLGRALGGRKEEEKCF
jgi:hypothetical protein